MRGYGRTKDVNTLAQSALTATTLALAHEGSTSGAVLRSTQAGLTGLSRLRLRRASKLPLTTDPECAFVVCFVCLILLLPE